MTAADVTPEDRDAVAHLQEVAHGIGTYFLGAWAEAMAGVRGEDWEQEAAKEAADQWLATTDERARRALVHAHLAAVAATDPTFVLEILTEAGVLRRTVSSFREVYPGRHVIAEPGDGVLHEQFATDWKAVMSPVRAVEGPQTAQDCQEAPEDTQGAHDGSGRREA